jgi:broad specificity phosphatase PhoE
VSRLFLVRHGQASFLEPDYDRLSSLGETQARLLGEYWLGQNLRFDCVRTGPLARQKDTARIVAEAYRDAGVPFPGAVGMPEFAEFDGEGVLRRALPGLLETNKQIHDLYWLFRNSRAQDRSKNFQRLFEIVVADWVRGDLCVPGTESWTEFRTRVNWGISEVLSECGHGVIAVVFCSGGPIAVAVERALHLAPPDTLRVLWMSRTCSYTEFLFSGDRFTLSTFNAFPHLGDPSLVQYR